MLRLSLQSQPVAFPAAQKGKWGSMNFAWRLEVFPKLTARAMKTEEDLLDAIARYSLESTGASEGQIDLMMRQFRTRLIPDVQNGASQTTN
jgi:acyl-CoA reductase-like NAD-dependent aldehyde dehydrogenase